jgi:hypothetical protein
MNKNHLGEHFLHQKDPKLHTSNEVGHEMSRKGKEKSKKPAEKISRFMEVLEKTHLGHRDDDRVMERIRGYYQKKHIDIEIDTIPQSYWNNQAKIMIEQGYVEI